MKTDITTDRRSLALIFFVLATMSAAYFSTVQLLGNAWMMQSGYSHGPLVFLIALWLIWREGGTRPISWPESPPASFFILAIVAGLIWMLAYLSAAQAVHMLAFIVLVYCAISWVFGAASFGRFMVPVGILVFAIPLWDLITPLLQQLTIAVNSKLLSWVGWTAYFVGDTVYIRSGSFHIAEGCGGTHFFVIGLTLGVLYGYLNFRSVAARIYFVALAAIVAMIANWVRVFVIVVVGDITNMQSFLIRVDHYYFGWLMFILAMIPLFLIGRVFQSWDVDATTVAEATVSAGVTGRKSRRDTRAMGAGRATAFVFGLILLAPPMLAAIAADDSLYTGVSGLPLPETIGSWQRASAPGDTSLPKPRFQGPQAEVFQLYARDDRQLALYLNRYTRQRQGAELVGYDNNWYSPQWQVQSILTRRVGDAESRHEVMSSVLEDGGEKRIMIYGYLIGDRLFASEPEVKLRGALQSLWGDPRSGAIAVVSVCKPDCETAGGEALEFLAAATPALTSALYGSLEKRQTQSDRG